MNTDRSDNYRQVSPTTVGLRGVCPRCAQGRLYASGLNPATGCKACGLDYSFINSGDGPAVFVILIFGFLILGAALAFENLVGPPIWLHVLLWVPVTLLSCFLALRFSKGVMIAMQYQTNAHEGDLVADKDPDTGGADG